MVHMSRDITLWGLQEQQRSQFFFLILISTKIHSTLVGVLYSVSRRDGISTLMKRSKPPPFEWWSNLSGFLNPSRKNWSLGNLLSGFVLDINRTSTLLPIWDARKEYLFLIEFMLSSPKIGRLKLFCLISFRHYLKLKSPLSWLSEFMLDGALITLTTEGCSRLLLSVVPEHSFPSQNFFIFANKFFASWLHPETFRCKPQQLSCLPVIFLLSMMLISSCKRWFVKWETVRASSPLSVCMVGVDN